MSGSEEAFLKEAYDSNWIAPNGPQLNQFELEMADYLNAKYCVGLSSGTAALHLSLRLIKS